MPNSNYAEEYEDLINMSRRATAQASGLLVSQQPPSEVEIAANLPPQVAQAIAGATRGVVDFGVSQLPVTGLGAPVLVRNYGFRSVTANGVVCKPFSTTSVLSQPLSGALPISDSDGKLIANVTVNVATGAPTGPASLATSSTVQGKGKACAHVVRNSLDGKSNLIKVWDAVYGIPWFCIAGSVVLLAIFAVILAIIIKAARRR